MFAATHSPSFAPFAAPAGGAPDSAWSAAGVWRAGELAGSVDRTLDTGYPALNAALPGGGWPVGALTELLQRRPGLGEWGLLAPALAHLDKLDPLGGAARAGAQTVALIGSPCPPLGPALAARALAPAVWLRVQATAVAERLWSAEQALRCAQVAAVLLWLPHAPAAHLRRLHLAAQTHGKLLFVFRPQDAAQHSSPAPLRLQLAWAEAGQGARDGAAPVLELRVLKRRGPPLAQPLRLATATPDLQALLLASRAQSAARRLRQRGVRDLESREQESVEALAEPTARKEAGHVVDRLAAWS